MTRFGVVAGAIALSGALATRSEGVVGSVRDRDASAATGAVAAPAESRLADKVRAYFDPLAASGEFTGVVRIASGDEVLFESAWREGRGAARSGSVLDDAFAIASLTKTFTSGAVLALVDEGRIGLDDPVAKFVPGFPRGEEITVRHLLLHASGLAEPDREAIGDRPIASVELVADIASRPLLFEPGARSRYSNAGFNVLARIVEIASGESFPEYLAKRFWRPLGMARTFDGSRPPEGARLGAGHIPGPEGPIAVDPINYAASLGSGSLLASAPDLGRWLAAVAERRFFDVLRQEWPYGWGKTSVLGREGIEQTGAVHGFVSVMQVYPEEKLTIVALSEIENGSWTRWGNDLATLVFGGEASAPVTPPAARLPEGLRRAAPGTYSSSEWTARIRDEDGYLWAYWNDFPTGKYLKHVGDGVFAIPSDNGRIRFVDLEGGRYRGFDWEFPSGDKLSLRRSD